MPTWRHSEGVAFQDGDSTYALFNPIGATLRQLTVQNELILQDDALEIIKVSGLTAALESKASQDALTSLSTLVDGKHDAIDDALSFSSGLYRISTTAGSFSIQRLIDGTYSPVMTLLYNNGISRMSVFGELRPQSVNGLSNLDIIDTITATQVIASNLYTKAQTDALLATMSANTDAIQGALDAKQDTITASTPLACGALVVTGPKNAQSFRAGSESSYITMQDGRHLACYNYINVGRAFNLQYFTGAAGGVRIGAYNGSLGVNTNPGAYNLHIVGNAFISTTLALGGNLTAPNIYTKSEVDRLLSTPIADGGLSIAKTAGLQDALLVRATISSRVAGLSTKQEKLDSFSTV